MAQGIQNLPPWQLHRSLHLPSSGESPTQVENPQKQGWDGQQTQPKASPSPLGLVRSHEQIVQDVGSRQRLW